MNGFLGVDLGTTAVKVVLFDESGMPVREASRELSLRYPAPDRIEQDPAAWYEIPCELIREVCEGLAPGAVKAIGVSSQGISIVPVDDAFLPLADGISWLDTRAEEETAGMTAAVSREAFFTVTGKHASPCYTLPKLLWLKKREPSLFAAADRFLMPLDYLTARLCGEAVTDATMAGGTMLYDLSAASWSRALCDRFGIPSEKLAEIRPTTAFAGWLNEGSKRLTGLAGEVAVAVGAQDQKIAAYGAGIEPGTVTMSLGTAGALEILCENRSDVLPSFSFDVDGRVSYVLEGCVNTFGAAIKWARDTVFSDLSYRDMDALAEKAPSGSGGVRFYPHLSGESTPHIGRRPRSGWTGLSLATDRGCLVRSLYEGLACETRLNLEAARRAGAPVNRLRVFGGGAKSDILCRILSDVTGVPIEAMTFSEAAAFGAAKAAVVCRDRLDGTRLSDSFMIPADVRSYAPSDPAAEDLFRAYRAEYDTKK